MKYAALICTFCCMAFGAQHQIILQVDETTDIDALLVGYNVVSVDKHYSRPQYRVVIQTSLSKPELKNQLYEQAGLQYIEDNQAASLGLLDAADGGTGQLLSLDDIVFDARNIFIIDSDTETFAPVYTQNHVEIIRADTCWPYASGHGVVVAVLDTGVDMNHPFIKDNLVQGWDFVDDDAFPQEELTGLDTNEDGRIDEAYGHGTHVAGIIKTVAPGVSIMPIRVADANGHADLMSLTEGVAYALMNGANVINLSLSVSDPSALLENWLDLANYANAVVVTSAGNQNSEELQYPATEPGVISVASLDAQGRKSSFSNYSRRVDMAAPGENIISAHPGDLYMARSGTSMSAPMISGEAALIMELVPGASSSYVRNRIEGKAKTVADRAYKNKLGGLADAWNAITVENVKR